MMITIVAPLCVNRANRTNSSASSDAEVRKSEMTERERAGEQNRTEPVASLRVGTADP